MDVPLVSVEEEQHSALAERGCRAKCRSMYRSCSEVPVVAALCNEIKGNVLKAMLVLATIIFSTYTAYTINNQQLQIELLKMQNKVEAGDSRLQLLQVKMDSLERRMPDFGAQLDKASQSLAVMRANLLAMNATVSSLRIEPLIQTSKQLLAQLQQSTATFQAVSSEIAANITRLQRRGSFCGYLYAKYNGAIGGYAKAAQICTDSCRVKAYMCTSADVAKLDVGTLSTSWYSAGLRATATDCLAWNGAGTASYGPVVNLVSPLNYDACDQLHPLSLLLCLTGILVRTVHVCDSTFIQKLFHFRSKGSTSLSRDRVDFETTSHDDAQFHMLNVNATHPRQQRSANRVGWFAR